eukprot:COSAG01_NODE_11056_length_2018_cov_1.075000_1_plen_273_part_10
MTRVGGGLNKAAAAAGALPNASQRIGWMRQQMEQLQQEFLALERAAAQSRCADRMEDAVPPPVACPSSPSMMLREQTNGLQKMTQQTSASAVTMAPALQPDAQVTWEQQKPAEQLSSVAAAAALSSAPALAPEVGVERTVPGPLLEAREENRELGDRGKQTSSDAAAMATAAQHSRSWRLKLQAGGEEGAAVLVSVLEHGLEALESSIPRIVRKERRAARALCEKLETLLVDDAMVGAAQASQLATLCKEEVQLFEGALEAVQGLRIGVSAGE